LAVPRPWEGGLRRGEIFGSALLRPARNMFTSPVSAFFIVYTFDRTRSKFTIRKLLGLRWPYFFLSTLAHCLNFVVGLTTTAVWVLFSGSVNLWPEISVRLPTNWQ